MRTHVVASRNFINRRRREPCKHKFSLSVNQNFFYTTHKNHHKNSSRSITMTLLLPLLMLALLRSGNLYFLRSPLPWILVVWINVDLRLKENLSNWFNLEHLSRFRDFLVGRFVRNNCLHRLEEIFRISPPPILDSLHSPRWKSKIFHVHFNKSFREREHFLLTVINKF